MRYALETEKPDVNRDATKIMQDREANKTAISALTENFEQGSNISG